MRRALLVVGLVGCGRMNFDPAEGEELRCDTLALDGAAANLNSKTQLAARGGYPPYQYAFAGAAPGGVALDAETGLLTVGDVLGTGTVEVTDVGGCRAQAQVELGGSTLFYVGGQAMGVTSNDVWRSVDGRTWEAVGNLPAERYWGGLVVLENRLLWIGGADRNSAAQDEIYATTDGVTWTEVGNTPFAATAFGLAMHQGRLYTVGGNNNADNVHVTDDGLAWTLAGHLPMDNHGGSLVSTGSELIYAGGHNGNLFDWVLASPDGASWAQVGTLAVPREYHTGIRIEDRMWLVGGQNTVPTPIANATATTDGTSWTAVPDLPVGRALGAMVQFGDRVWSFGGTNNAGVYSTNVAGSEPWQIETSNFPSRQAGMVARFTPAAL